MPDRTPELVAAAAHVRLKEARELGDELAAGLAEHELNRALDTIAARKGPGRARSSSPGRRPSPATPKTGARE